MIVDRTLIGSVCAAGVGAALVLGAADPPVERETAAPDPAARMAVAPQAFEATGEDGGTSVIPRAADGMFYITARVNRTPVRFLIDTGSNAVVLGTADAKRLGLADADAPTTSLATAGGAVPMRWTSIARLDVASVTLRHLDVVVPERGPQVSLLGASVLRALGPVLIDGDRMTIGSAPRAAGTRSAQAASAPAPSA